MEWYSKVKSFFGFDAGKRPTNTLRGNFVLKHCTPIQNDFYLDMSDSPIGKGSFGVVMKGTNLRSRQDFAIKVVSKQGNLARIEREIQLLTDIDHVHIIRLFSVYEADDTVSFVFALCGGGHLGNLLNRSPNKYLTEDKAKVIIRQVASAVAHLHSLGICHRDIKLQNILLEGEDDVYPQIKLIDFGFACRFRGCLPLSTRCGTTYCTAPEVFREEYDERCDVWSVGVVAYSLLSGHKPFSALEIPGSIQSGKAAVVTNILMARYHFNYYAFKNVSAEGIQFIEKMFEPLFQSRCSSRQALDLPWLLNAACGPPATELLAAKNTPLSIAMSTLYKKGNNSKIGNTGMVAVAFSNSKNGFPELRSLFQGFDEENQGFLSQKAFRRAMKSINPSLSSREIDSLFTAIDVDGDKAISFTEFLAATMDPRQVDTEELSKAFQLLDCENKGYLTINDFYRVLAVAPNKYKMFHLSKNRERCESDDTAATTKQVPDMAIQSERERNKLLKQISDMISAADENKDGVISYSEFLLGVMGAERTEEEDIFDADAQRGVGDREAMAIARNTDAFCSKLSSSKYSSPDLLKMTRKPNSKSSGLRNFRKTVSNFELNSPKFSSSVHCDIPVRSPKRRLSASKSEPEKLSDMMGNLSSDVGQNDSFNKSGAYSRSPKPGSQFEAETFLHVDIESPHLYYSTAMSTPNSPSLSPHSERRIRNTPWRLQPLDSPLRSLSSKEES